MIKIRLSRSGVRNKPFYRIVAIDHKLRAKGNALEVIGTYFPSKKAVKIDKEKFEKWIKVGAQVTPAVEKLVK